MRTWSTKEKLQTEGASIFLNKWLKLWRGMEEMEGKESRGEGG